MLKRATWRKLAAHRRSARERWRSIVPECLGDNDYDPVFQLFDAWKKPAHAVPASRVPGVGGAR